MRAVDPLIIHRMAMSLRASLPAGEHFVVLVSSAAVGEGKSTVAGLLARALAAQGPDPVLLVDGGTSSPGSEGNSLAGIERLLAGSPLSADLLRAEAVPRLFKLGHGPQFRVTQWFQPAAVSALLAQCRQRFALTLIDGPSLPGCGALLSAVDRAVLVVDAQRTPVHAIRAALADARIPTERLAGVILNHQPAPLPRWLGA
jgi:polysaccharide biosynthesis transport protein